MLLWGLTVTNSELKRKTPMRSTASLRAAGPARTSIKVSKAKCKVCRAVYAKRSMTHKACSGPCAEQLVATEKAKAAARAAREDRQQTKVKLETMKSIAQLIQDAQDAFNLFVRVRDNRRGCISCGRPLQRGGVGGGFDAGHYRSRGAATHLRFNEDNCHGQCKGCNRPGGALPHQYRAGLVGRIGERRVVALEISNEVHQWGRQELLDLKTQYRSKARELEKQREREMEPA